MALKEIGRQRAAFALDKVKNISRFSALEFKAQVKSVPMMIKTNGLAAAYAFVYSKSEKKHYQEILNVSREWLKQQKLIKATDNEAFYQELLAMNPYDYRRTITELLALFTWLKRFADALISE
jgi:CRISPR-associated protein Cmr5